MSRWARFKAWLAELTAPNVCPRCGAAEVTRTELTPIWINDSLLLLPYEAPTSTFTCQGRCNKVCVREVSQ